MNKKQEPQVIKITAFPKEVMEKVEIIGNVFDRLNKNKEKFESITCKLSVLLTDKYKLTNEQWNKDIAPILRIFYD